MPEIILSINAGSSSVKISVFKTPEDGAEVPKQLAEASVDGLTAPPAKLKYARGDETIKGKELDGISSQKEAFEFILDHLTKDEGLTELNNKEDIHFTCHRVVHGGDYPRSQVIDKETYHHIEELSDLAPLHNAPALSIVRAVADILPHARNIAYFDSFLPQYDPRACMHISYRSVCCEEKQAPKVRFPWNIILFHNQRCSDTPEEVCR